jgi:hypothetical protein
MCRTFLVFLFLYSAHSNAAPVVWTLDNVHFEDGGIATGSYTYDADSGYFSDVVITTTAGSMLSGGSFDIANCSNAECTQILVRRAGFQIAKPALYLSFDAPMTNVGGALPLVLAGSRQFDGLSTNRDIISGAVTTVPIPSAVWLFGSALAGLGWMRRRKTV